MLLNYCLERILTVIFIVGEHHRRQVRRVSLPRFLARSPEAGLTSARRRKLLNPVFSAAHMRYMIPIFYKISHQVTAFLELDCTLFLS